MLWRRVLVGPAIVVALLATGCAGVGGTAGGAGSASAPRTIRVDVTDRGATVSMRVGDRLIVSLPGFGRSSGSSPWRLVRYPDALRPVPASSPAGFGFIARSPGRGTLLAIGTIPCHQGEIRCPVEAPQADAFPVPPRPLSFFLIVRVGT